MAASDVADTALAGAGEARIEWADGQMPVLRSIRERFARERPLEGVVVGACLHVTSETANLVRTLAAGGADVALCASNPFATHDEVAAALARGGVEVHAVRGEGPDAWAARVAAVVARGPRITLDDGADLLTALHLTRPDLLDGMLGGTEETTTGLVRLRALDAEGRLACPVVAVNEALTERGDVLVTVTGVRDVLRAEHFARMKDGAVLANAGHFDVEIDLPALRAAARSVREVRPLVEQYDLGGRRVNLLDGGRVVNLAAAEGHPAAVMDLSFALQALVAEQLVRRGGELAPGVHSVPDGVDREVAELKLASLGVEIDALSEEQELYLRGWRRDAPTG